MFKKSIFPVILILVLTLALIGCAPSEAQIQKAIAQTQTAMPTATATATPLPTVTPVPTATATPYLRPGLDTPVYSLGLDLRFYAVKQLDSLVGPDGQTYYPDTGYVIYDVFAETVNGPAQSVLNWPQAGDAAQLAGNGASAGWYSVSWSSDTGPSLIDWVFVVPQSLTVTQILLPGGVAVDLSPLLP